jgi:hypothetical protein
MPKYSGKPDRPVLSICSEIKAHICTMNIERFVASKNRNTWGPGQNNFLG